MSVYALNGAWCCHVGDAFVYLLHLAGDATYVALKVGLSAGGAEGQV